MVLLGASNVALGLLDATDAARAKLAAPVEVLAACGHGRSYGSSAKFLTRTLCSIDGCGLWAALERLPRARTCAVVTDYGNDIAFGFGPERSAGWLERVLDRLAAHGAEVVLTGLPLAALERIGPIQFRFWKSVFFPTRRFTRERVLAEVRELDARVGEIARRRGLAKLDPRLAWYGLDPIHIARGQRPQAWGAYVGAWSGAQARAVSRAALRGRLWHERVRVLGMEVGRAQPCATLSDGTTFSLY